MTHFRCIPMPTETATRFRTSGRDDSDNALRRMTADTPTGYPCRHCLTPAEPGQAMLLGSYVLPRPRGIYWTPSPVFVHADPCPAFDQADTIAPIIAVNTLVSVRAYDAADQVIYELGQVCDGAEAAAPIARALEDSRTAFLNIHTARPGCLLCTIQPG